MYSRERLSANMMMNLDVLCNVDIYIARKSTYVPSLASAKFLTTYHQQ